MKNTHINPQQLGNALHYRYTNPNSGLPVLSKIELVAHKHSVYVVSDMGQLEMACIWYVTSIGDTSCCGSGTFLFENQTITPNILEKLIKSQPLSVFDLHGSLSYYKYDSPFSEGRVPIWYNHLDETITYLNSVYDKVFKLHQKVITPGNQIMTVEIIDYDKFREWKESK